MHRLRRQGKFDDMSTWRARPARPRVRTPHGKTKAISLCSRSRSRARRGRPTEAHARRPRAAAGAVNISTPVSALALVMMLMIVRDERHAERDTRSILA